MSNALKAREALEAARAFANKTAGSTLGLAMSGDDHPNPDEVLMGLSSEGMELASKLSAALSALDLSAIGAEGSAPNQNFETLVADAKRAATALYDWTCVNEAEWAGWGECEVPPGAKFWRVKAGQAVKALDELPSPPEPRS